MTPGYSISRVVTGGWQLVDGHGADGFDRSSVVADLRRLVDRGFTTFDGADIYTGVEVLFGELVAELASSPEGDRRSEVQIHTKVVPDLADLPSLRRAEVTAIVDRSLRRLRVERLDLVQFHWWDWRVPGYLAALGWLVDLADAGKIRHLGVTNFDRAHLEEVFDAGIPLVAHQLQVSLIDRRPDRGVAELCERHGVGLLAYGTLAGGFLSDRWLGRQRPSADEVAARNRSLVKYRLIIDDGGGWQTYQELLAVLRAIASRYATTVAAVAMAWTLRASRTAAIVVGAGHAKRLDETVRGVNLILTADDEALIDGVLRGRSGLPGDVYGLERQQGGKHAAIMRPDLHRTGDGTAEA